MKNILITGVAGFIGSNLAKKYISEGYNVIGIDSINDYYDPQLKLDRLSKLENNNFKFVKIDISDKDELMDLFDLYKPDVVFNLAAQAGVRYSIENPDVYISSNIVGFFNILEACRHYGVKKLFYASSSSVYGGNTKVPFEEDDNVDRPVSLYAATKKSNELMAETYSHLFDIQCIGLRFFTVYGPFGRPDMAYFGFVNKFFKGESIQIYNNGDFNNDLYRDFTFINDIIEGIYQLDQSEIVNKHEVFNIGNNSPVRLMDFITTLEKCLSKSLNQEIVFKKDFVPIKPGDVPATYASTAKLEKITGYKPSTSLENGLMEFTDWYVEYYGKKVK